MLEVVDHLIESRAYLIELNLLRDIGLRESGVLLLKKADDPFLIIKLGLKKVESF